MTPEDHARWETTALALAALRHDGARPSRQWAVDKVQGFFDCLDRREVEHYIDWDRSRRGDTGGWWPIVCDQMDHYIEDLFRERVGGHLECCDSGDPRHVYYMCARCEEIDWQARDQWAYGPWGGAVSAPVRAAMDMVVGGCGVIGYTVGDLRRIFPDGIPEWAFPDGEQLETWDGEPVGTIHEQPDEQGLVL